MQGFLAVLKRELKGYFATPVAYVFLVIFLFAAGLWPFIQNFFEIRQADLRLFFSNIPVLFMLFIPAVAMRLWAEERKSGSIELLLTLPVTVPQAVLGKFFAAWAFLGIALLLTFPLPVVVIHLGDPDIGQIVTGYIGAFMMAGGFLAIGSFFSALTKNQVISFILSVVACAVLVFADNPTTLNYLSESISPSVVTVAENLSFRAHFESIMRGVVEFKDVAYFGILIAAWVYACTLILVDKTARAIVGIFFVLVIAVSAISITQNLGKQARWDITERKLYTLSDGTKEILTELKQPITLKLFYTKTAAMKASDQIRFYNNYYSYVKALLEEYEVQSEGNVVLEVVDPRPYSDEEMAAIRHGLRRFNITEDESFFFGMVVQTQFGVTKTIDFFSPDRQQFVEYDISYLIDTAVTRQKTRLGVLSSLPVMGDSEYMLRMMQMQGQQGQRKWGIIAHLEKQFEISSVPADTDKITDVDLLMVIHPKNLPEKTLFAIDQFVLKGGRAIVCVDPHSIADPPDRQQQMQGMQHDAGSNMPELLKAWGLEMPAMTFAGDRSLAVTGAANPSRRPEKILSIMKLSSAKNCFNKDNPIVAELGEVTTAFGGVLKTLPQDENSPEMEHIPLLMTSDEGNSWTVENPYELMNPNYGAFMRRFRDGSEPVVMGYMVTGNFKSAFPEGIEVENEAANADPNEPPSKTVTGLTEATESGAVVVLADVDFLSDMVAYQRTFFGLAPLGDNSTLILNALESLSGSNRLISIRSRGSYERPFTVVNDIETKAEEETLEETRAIELQVKEFERQLNEKLQSLQGDNKGALINQTILEEKKDIELKLRDAEKRLRDIKMQKRELVEKLKEKVRFYCTIPGPICVLMIAVVLGIYRSVKRRRYISHASDA